MRVRWCSGRAGSCICGEWWIVESVRRWCTLRGKRVCVRVCVVVWVDAPGALGACVHA